MPGSGSNGFVAPSAAQQADWRTVVRQMLEGSCNFAVPASLFGVMQLRTFIDTGNGKGYCLLMEIQDSNSNGKVDRGWGTFIVDSNADRELSHQAPHPIYDSTTENEGVGIFRDTNSRSYLMCGAHRLANSQTSSCQASYEVADCAHNVANMFQPTNQELLAFYGAGPWTAIQWHGMAASTCDVEAYLTHGRNQAPVAGDKILDLQNHMLTLHPMWNIGVPGSSACTLNATDNVQGRLLNGVPAGSVCGTAAVGYSGRFIHNEQDPGFRNPVDWVQAVKDTWTLDPPLPPVAPTGLTATAGNARVDLKWSAASGATSYKVKRSTVHGGPYAPLATTVATNYTDTAVVNGTNYFYVTTAVNATGESTESLEVNATPVAPQPPSAPTGLTASGGKKKITLSWVAASGAASYNVKRSTTNGGPYSLIATGVIGVGYTNTGLQTSRTYYYVVSAVNGNGESQNSNQASATVR